MIYSITSEKDKIPQKLIISAYKVTGIPDILFIGNISRTLNRQRLILRALLRKIGIKLTHKVYIELYTEDNTVKLSSNKYTLPIFITLLKIINNKFKKMYKDLITHGSINLNGMIEPTPNSTILIVQKIFKEKQILNILKIPSDNITILNLLNPANYIQRISRNNKRRKQYSSNMAKQLIFLTREQFKKEQNKFKFLTLKDTEFTFIDEDKLTLIKYNNLKYVHVNYTEIQILNEILNSNYLNHIPFLIAPYTLLSKQKNKWLYQNLKRINKLTLLTWFCPCGNLLSKDKCTCSNINLQKYLNTISIKIYPYMEETLIKKENHVQKTKYEDLCTIINELTL